ncbi:hypothetical protein HCH_05606 [Hahella chejuensis KCTC 2396]|uniref:Uncharacterized protein n=1 Tax=Hahella chejuensis (strain KCTC 2396) TaxID=349521 RepID=Q2SAR0_HAHCH|nr:hypothetical protein [Hahella chejuensis]ABC32264.1 hypothetical protein HCH_05606 [Hahella chejuensis KCTC 2396]
MKTFSLDAIGYWSAFYENEVTPAYLCGELNADLKSRVSNYLKNGIRGMSFLGYARCRFECEDSETNALGCADMTTTISSHEWNAWLKEMGEDEYLKSPVIVPKKVHKFDPDYDPIAMAHLMFGDDDNQKF